MVVRVANANGLSWSRDVRSPSWRPTMRFPGWKCIPPKRWPSMQGRTVVTYLSWGRELPYQHIVKV